MEKKEKENIYLERTLRKVLPQEQYNYIKQPFNFSLLHGYVKKSQQKQMVLIMERLQPQIEKWLSLSYQEKLNQPSLFDGSQNNFTVSIRLMDMGIDSQNYQKAKDAAQLLATQIYQYTTVDDKGHRVVTFSPLFKKVEIIDSLNSGNSRSPVMINFTFNEEILTSDLMLMNRYTKYGRNIALSTGIYTSRLYIILSSYVFSDDKKWVVDYAELRKILGVDEIKSEKTWIKKKYIYYSQFKRNVLDSSKEELDTLATDNKTEFVFTYEEIYKDKQTSKTGNPDKIAFHIKLTELGSSRHKENENVIKIRHELFSVFGFTTTDISSIDIRLYDFDIDAALELIAYVFEKVGTKKDLYNKKAYIIKCINNEIEYRQNAENIEEAQAEELKNNPDQLLLPFEDMFSPQADSLFQQFVQKYKEIDSNFASIYLRDDCIILKEEKVDEHGCHTFVFELPSRFVIDVVTERFEEFKKIFESIFGKNSVLQFTIKK